MQVSIRLDTEKHDDIERLMERNPEKYLLALKDKVSEKKAEIQALEEKMDDLKDRIAKEKEATDAPAPSEDSSLTQT